MPGLLHEDLTYEVRGVLFDVYNTLGPMLKEDYYTQDLLYPKLVNAVQRACHRVHFALGPGFLHQVYRRATMIELRRSGLSYEYIKRLPVIYEGELIGQQDVRLILVEGKVLFTVAGLAVRLFIFWRAGLYSRYWRYASVDEIALIVLSVFLATTINTLLFFTLRLILPLSPSPCLLVSPSPALLALDRRHAHPHSCGREPLQRPAGRALAPAG